MVDKKTEKQIRANAASVPGAGKPRVVRPLVGNQGRGARPNSVAGPLTSAAASKPGAGQKNPVAPVKLRGVARADTLRSGNTAPKARALREPSGRPSQQAARARRGGVEVPQDPQGHDASDAPSSTAASEPGRGADRLNSPKDVLR